MKRKIQSAINLSNRVGFKNTFWYAIRYYYQMRFLNIQKRKSDEGLKTSTSRLMDYPFQLHPSMLGVSNAVHYFGVHEPLTTQVYLDSIHNGDHIIEIGANIGYYVLLAHSKVGDSGCVLGFEPVPDNFDILHSNVSRYSNINIYPLAVGNKNGHVDFYTSTIPNWGALSFNHNLNMNTEPIHIQMINIDDFLPSYSKTFFPNMIHMDIEGGEIVALDGAWQTIEAYKPRLFIEFHPFSTGFEFIVNILERLSLLGYKHAIFIDRQIDEPWIPQIIRRQRKKQIVLDDVVDWVHKSCCPLCFTLMIHNP